MSENEFKGYLKNKYHLGGHIMKRYVAPNGQVPLEELYKQYGPKHGLPRDESFIVWLREVKLKDSDRWVVVDEDDLVETNKLLAEEKKLVEEDATLDKKPSDLQVSELAELSVRKARAALPQIADQRILKYALKEASQRPNKDSLCNLIRKRLSELQSQGIG